MGIAARPETRVSFVMSAIHFHQTRRGVLAHFAADMCIGQSLARYGEWAEDEIALLSPYLPEGGVALDVGANVGAHTVAFAKCVGPSGHVISIEGQPAAFTLLAHNVVANGLSNVVTALPILAGTADALVAHEVTPITDNVGAKSFFSDVHGKDVHGNAVQPGSGSASRLVGMKLALIPIDGLGLARCDLMKVDVEGMELDVVKGAIGLISDLQPVVYFEHAVGDIDEIFGLFKGAGYRLFWHVANPYNRLNFKGDAHNIFGGNTELNVLAIPAGKRLPAGLKEIERASDRAPSVSLEDGIGGVSIP